MKLKYLLISLAMLFVMFVSTIKGQEIITNLNGFYIGQYREAAKNEFGDPAKTGKMDDGFEHEIYLLKKDGSLYMVFECSPENKELLWSIQVTGTDSECRLGFKDLKFGDDKNVVLKALGKPDKIEDIGEYGECWKYNNTNYTVEVKDGRLSSVKIFKLKDEKEYDFKKVPEFINTAKILSLGSNEEITALLDPAMELYVDGKTLFFQKSMRTEIKTDFSSIFSNIKKACKDLEKLDTKDESAFNVSMRVSGGQPVMHVFSINKGYSVKEIVFKYRAGKYYIWELLIK